MGSDRNGHSSFWDDPEEGSDASLHSLAGHSNGTAQEPSSLRNRADTSGPYSASVGSHAADAVRYGGRNGGISSQEARESIRI